MTDYLHEELRAAIQDASRKPVIICGAGLSRQATANQAPGWSDLIASGVARVAGLDPNARAWADSVCALLAGGTAADWISVADELTQRLGGAYNAEFRDWLRTSVGRLRPLRRDLVDAVLELGCPIATTNYDDVLERASGQPPLLWSDHAGTVDWIGGRRDGILHLHGHWAYPESVILGSVSYEAHAADARRELLQHLLALDRPTIHIGCSRDGLEDPDFSRLSSFVSEWSQVAGRRYWLIRAENADDGTPVTPPSPEMIRRLFPVVFGARHEDLAGYLKSLVPSPLGLKSIDRHVPRPAIFGRDAEIDTIVNALLAGRAAVVAGGPGMGKTTAAVASLYDDRVREAFGPRRVFVSLEAASEPREMLSRTADALGLSAIGSDAAILGEIAARTPTNPTAVILDNAETVFDVDRNEAERLFRLLAQVDGLAPVLTIRHDPPTVPKAAIVGDLPKLDDVAAREAFLAIAGDGFAGDPSLAPLLAALEGHALSLSLIAARARSQPTLVKVLRRWNELHGDLLREPGAKETRLSSVRASLALSLESQRMRQCPEAQELLSLLAYLPGGLSPASLRPLLGEEVDQARCEDASDVVRELRLVERRSDDQLRMLTPLRESVKSAFPISSITRGKLLAYFLPIAAEGGAIGTKRWPEVQAFVEEEADNLDSICSLAVEQEFDHPKLDDALWGLAEFSRFSGRGSVSSLHRAVEASSRAGATARLASHLFRWALVALARSDHEVARARYDQALSLFGEVNDVLGQANCIQNLGELCLTRSDHEGARARFEQALPLYQKVGSVLGEANCITNLGDIALRRSDLETARKSFERALPLFEQSNDLLGEANCIKYLGEIALLRSESDDARAKYEKALLLYQNLGDLLGEANTVRALGDVDLKCSDFAAAAGHYEKALPLFRQVGNVLGEANCVHSLGNVEYWTSNLDAAERRYKSALPLYQIVGSVRGEAHCLRSLADVALKRADHGPARRGYEQAMLLYRKVGDLFSEAYCNRGLGDVAAMEGNQKEAKAHYETAVSLWEKGGYEFEATSLQQEFLS